MPTQKQRKLAKELIENIRRDKPLTAQELLENIGYSKSVAKALASKIIQSKGVKEELQKYGFNEENAKTVVSQILLKGKKEKNRLTAADMVFKVIGTYAPKKMANLNLNLTKNLDDPALKELEEKYNELIRQKYLKGKKNENT